MSKTTQHSSISFIKKVFCSRCKYTSIVNLAERHIDPANGEVNPLVFHCTFCTEVLDI